MSDTPTAQTPELRSDAPSDAPKEPTVKLIVDGEEQEWPQSKLVAQAQKFAAAEKRLQEASELKKKYTTQIELGEAALKLGSKDENERIEAYTKIMEAGCGIDANTSASALDLFKSALSNPTPGDTRMSDTTAPAPRDAAPEPTPAQKAEFLLQVNQLPPEVQEIVQAFKDAQMSAKEFVPFVKEYTSTSIDTQRDAAVHSLIDSDPILGKIYSKEVDPTGALRRDVLSEVKDLAPTKGSQKAVEEVLARRRAIAEATLKSLPKTKPSIPGLGPAALRPGGEITAPSERPVFKHGDTDLTGFINKAYAWVRGHSAE